MRYMIYGQTQTGKTWYSHYILSKYLKNDLRSYYVITDTQVDQYEENLKDMNFEKATVDKYSVENVDYYKLIQDNPRLFIHFQMLNNDQLDSHLSNLARDLQYLGNSFVILDEAWQIWGVHEKKPELQSLVRAGEKTGLDWCMITQQPVDLAMDSRTQVEKYITFRVHGDSHAKKIAEKMNGGQELKNKITELPERTMYQFDTETQELAGPISTEEKEISL